MIYILRKIPAIISPDLMKVLMEMGHTDEITIGDGNFPGYRLCDKIIRLDGHGIPEVLKAILEFFPLDTYVEKPITLISTVKGDPVKTPIWNTYKEIVREVDSRGDSCFEEIDKLEFYKKVSEKSYAVIMTSEKSLYANIILKKGVI